MKDHDGNYNPSDVDPEGAVKVMAAFKPGANIDSDILVFELGNATGMFRPMITWDEARSMLWEINPVTRAGAHFESLAAGCFGIINYGAVDDNLSELYLSNKETYAPIVKALATFTLKQSNIDMQTASEALDSAFKLNLNKVALKVIVKHSENPADVITFSNLPLELKAELISMLF